MDTKPTAVVVDDDKDILTLTATVVEMTGIKVVARDTDGNSALEHLREYRPDLAVIDILLPNITGLELLETIRREGLCTRSIMITGHRQMHWVTRASEAGASGYLIKPHTELLPLAMAAALKGEQFLGSFAAGVASAELVRLSMEERTRGLLTPKEIEVLRHRVNGKCGKEISALIDRSPKTVEKHVTSLKKKLDAHTDADLVRYALKIGLIRL